MANPEMQFSERLLREPVNAREISQELEIFLAGRYGNGPDRAYAAFSVARVRHSIFLSAFGYLIAMNLMRRFCDSGLLSLRAGEAGQAYDGSSVPVRRFTEKTREPYYGALADCMRIGNAMYREAVLTLIDDLTGPLHPYVGLWELFGHAYDQKQKMHAIGKERSKFVRIFAPFVYGERSQEEDLLVTFEENLEVGVDLAVHAMVAYARRRRPLPDASDIARNFLELENTYRELSRTNRQLYNIVSSGLPATREATSARRAGSDPPLVSSATRAMNSFLKNPAIPLKLDDVVLEAELLTTIGSDRTLPILTKHMVHGGNCAGARSFVPLPAETLLIKDFASKTGGELPERIGAADVDLRLTGGAIASQTIYGDEIMRRGVQMFPDIDSQTSHV